MLAVLGLCCRIVALVVYLYLAQVPRAPAHQIRLLAVWMLTDIAAMISPATKWLSCNGIALFEEERSAGDPGQLVVQTM